MLDPIVISLGKTEQALATRLQVLVEQSLLRESSLDASQPVKIPVPNEFQDGKVIAFVAAELSDSGFGRAVFHCHSSTEGCCGHYEFAAPDRRGDGRVAPGVISLIGAAAAKRADAGFDCLLAGGDLATMAIQKRFLLGQGIEVGQQDVYPAVRSADYPRALRLIFENKVAGWWNLRGELIKNEVCTAEQFRAAVQ